MVFATYLTEILLLAGCGILIGLAVGARPSVCGGGARGRPDSGAACARAACPALGVGAALRSSDHALFALWPLGRAHDLPVSALFRDQVARSGRRPKLRYGLAAAAALAALAAVAVVPRL